MNHRDHGSNFTATFTWQWKTKDIHVCWVSDLQDFGRVHQVCEELRKRLAAEGQPEQVASSALSWEQLPAGSALLNSQGQSRKPAHMHTSRHSRRSHTFQTSSSTGFLSDHLSRTWLPATGILVEELFKAMPVISMHQTENWLWKEIYLYHLKQTLIIWSFMHICVCLVVTDVGAPSWGPAPEAHSRRWDEGWTLSLHPPASADSGRKLHRRQETE